MKRRKMNQSNKIPLTQQESEELAREIRIERERKEHYKKQLEMLKNKKKSGQIKDAENFKIQSLPIDMREIMKMELEDKF